MGGLDGEDDGVEEVAGGLDEGHGGIEPADDELVADLLDVRLDLARDVEVVAIERDALHVGPQVLLRLAQLALVRNLVRRLS